MRIEETVVNVIFLPGSKGSVSVNSREAILGKPLGKLPVPMRQGYVFDGWYAGDTLVDEHTVLTENEDLRLEARWKKRVQDAKSKKISMYKKQKAAAVVLSVVALALVVTLLVVNHIVAIYSLEDVYYGSDGTEYTEKYYVKKKDGVYGMYDRSGKLMECDEDGNYFAKSGNAYSVDPETGEYELFAIVDYDMANGELLNVQKTRVMMYKRISQENIDSIIVKNQVDSYRYYRDKNGVMQIEGVESSLVSYDAEKVAGLCVDCGYSLTMQKLDFTSPHTPRLPDGSVDYSAYGLADVYDENGKLIYTPSVFEITGVPDNETESVTHTVQIGDPCVSNGGYYARRVGYDAVYIVDTGVKESVLQPVESLVIPMVVYPTTSSLYMEVYDFVLGTANLKDSVQDPTKAKLDIIVSFTYQDLAARLNTLFTSSPYVALSEPWASMTEYAINDYNASTVFGNMHQMQFLSCVELGIFDENGKVKVDVMEKYGLNDDVYYMSYKTIMLNSSGAPQKDENGNQLLATNQLVISPKTERGTYYIASMMCNMIVEVDQLYLSFLDWEISDWYHEYFYTYNMAYVKNLTFTVGDRTYTISLDNKLSYAYYENEEGEMKLIDLSKGKLIDHENGAYTYVDRNGVSRPVKMIDFSNKNGFTYQKGSVIYTDTDGKVYEFSVSAANAKVYMEEYLNKNGTHLMDYVITDTYIDDAGVEKTKQISARENFSDFYIKLLYMTIEGDVDEAEFEANMGMSIKDYIAKHGNECQASLRYLVKDHASVMNQYTYTNDKGEVVKLWTEDNEREVIIRFYRYSERKSLMTIELIEDYDENGEPITDPTNAIGSFYVLSSYLEEIADAGDMLLNQELIDPDR